MKPDHKAPPPRAAPSGAPMSNMQTRIVDAAPRTVRRRGVFTVSGGVEAGRVLAFEVGDLATFGRAPECTFPFDDPSLSREHARVLCSGSDYIFKDAGSTNGSFVNDVRVTRAVTLDDGDRVQLGSGTMLRFALVDDAEEQALRRVYDAGIRDGLTGIYNRKHLEERMTGELAFAARHQTDLGVVLFDVDHFKRVNDTWGHLAGDAVLRATAALLGSGLRAEDVIARYGGEEFMILVRGADAAFAVALANRLRLLVEASPISFEDQRIAVTASAGVATLAETGADRTALIGAADARLYQAKEGGRNRVVGPG